MTNHCAQRIVALLMLGGAVVLPFAPTPVPAVAEAAAAAAPLLARPAPAPRAATRLASAFVPNLGQWSHAARYVRSEEHTSELQSQSNLVCRLLLEKKKPQN